MTKAEEWTGISDDAQLYEDKFVPTLFGPWAPQVADAALITPGDRVLDVGCGTGVLAREVFSRVGPYGRVTGLDLDAGMLTVAERVEPRIEWRRGNAENLPFDDSSFEVVVSQFALMYFPDRVAALREMRRVLAPGGRLALAVWGPFERAKGYTILADLLRDYGGQAAVDVLKAPHVLGDETVLAALLKDSGFSEFKISLREGGYRQPTIAYFVESEVKGSPLHQFFTDDSYQDFLGKAQEALKPFRGDGEEVIVPMDAQIVTARKAR